RRFCTPAGRTAPCPWTGARAGHVHEHSVSGATPRRSRRIMSKLLDYAERYRNVRLERRDGILQVTLHTDGESLTWGAVKGSVHEQLGEAFYHIGRDRENRVV